MRHSFGGVLFSSFAQQYIYDKIHSYSIGVISRKAHTMLKRHLDIREDLLLRVSKAPAISGHSLHKGIPREVFIKEFLLDHLGENVGIGTGEIIDANSIPHESRNQIDIVVYRKSFPKLHYGGGIHAFLAESVIATIEVKSFLTKKGLQQSILTARRIKALQQNHFTQSNDLFHLPGIISYVVAYNGPKKMNVVHRWTKEIYRQHGISEPAMESAWQERIKIPSSSLEGIFVLGKGHLYFDNAPINLFSDDDRRQHPTMRWFMADQEQGNLYFLFLLLTQAITIASASQFNPTAYVRDLPNKYGFSS